MMRCQRNMVMSEEWGAEKAGEQRTSEAKCIARYALEKPVRRAMTPVTRDAYNHTVYGRCSLPSRKRKEDRVATV